MRRSAFFAFLALIAFVASSFLDEPASARTRNKSRSHKAVTRANFDTKLPVLGTRLSEFPPGAAKTLADQACLSCHSADITGQQRLTEKQWTAEVSKMIGWGADVPEASRAQLIAYLVANFGSDNTKFQPVVTRPVGR